MHNYKTKNFTLDEVVNSPLARRYQLNNDIKDLKVFVNICNSMNKLQMIRDIFQAPIIINSGYRCSLLNDFVGGALDSDHMKGLGFDLRGITPAESLRLYDLICDDKRINCYIRYKKYYTNGYVHISFKG